jgi:hypothetical protein
MVGAVMGAASQNNWVTLGALSIAADATTTGVLQFPSYDLLMIQYFVAGYSVADTAGFNFNMTQDFGFGGFHADRHLYAPSGTTVLTDSFDNAGAAGTGLSVRVAGFTTTQAQGGVAHVQAASGISGYHPVVIYNSTTSAAGTTPPIEMPGAGAFQLTDAIYSVELLTRGGNNMLAGSGFTVFGANIG